MQQSNLENYCKQKLNQSDLDAYSLKLNEVYNKYALSLEDLWQARQQRAQELITTKEYQNIKERCKADKKKYDDVKSTKIFKNNLENITKIKKNEPKSSPDYEHIEKHYEEAKELYSNFKNTVHERGKYGELAKLNNIAVKGSHISFKYADDQNLVLNDINFEIEQGEYVTIIGHNGSGKSTLSKLLIGVLSADEGIISFFGNSMNNSNVERVRQFTGIVFQNPDNQFIGSTVKDDIAFGLENKRVEPALMPGIIENVAKRVGMEDFLDREPLMLSGGQKQRVAIASTLAINPDIIIFDEATSMLDPKGRKEIKNIMVDLRNEHKKTIISITHDMDEILNADKVIVMNEGKIIRIGSPKQIMSDREFLSSVHLNLPFVGMVEDAIKNTGLDIKMNAQNIDELVDEICAIKPIN